MARRDLPHQVDTVIIGGGPSSLILSYILHGHVPYYSKTHHDRLLNAKLSKEPNLLKITPEAYAHFYSSLRYSTQALPLNTLLDTLIRPNADTDVNPESCVEWRYQQERAKSHVILTNGPDAGGQWVDNPADASPDIGTLSYSEMLSLPGYSYAEHYELRNMACLPDLQRPLRTEVADYYAVYPRAVGIQDSFYTSVQVGNVVRTDTGFFIASHNIYCKHLVLATGIFSQSVPPPLLFSPLARLQIPSEPLLVIGSGFSAADVIISVPQQRKILHIFRWAPETRPSPLRGCHHQAYPEYAGIYRQMKLAAMSSTKSRVQSPMMRRKTNPFFTHRDWATVYEGLPNAEIVDVKIDGVSTHLRIRLESGDIIDRTVGGMAYVVGRRGSLDYLDNSLRREVLSAPEEMVTSAKESSLISGRSLRAKVEIDFEVAHNVFAIGSLTGDSLVRHAFGGCVFAASRIMGVAEGISKNQACGDCVQNEESTDRCEIEMNGGAVQPNGSNEHADLHIDRRAVVAR